MKHIYHHILKSKATNQKLLAILIDPEKIDLDNIEIIMLKINQSPATHIFVGGSRVKNNILDELILKIKLFSNLPVVLFPGNPSQISNKADGILLLSLISGRNPDYLIEHHVNAVPFLLQSNLEIIPTGYILIESGATTAVERVSKTKPLLRNNLEYILQTAQAGAMLGNKLIYLEAGSGADHPVSKEIIKIIATNLSIPIIVGGGISHFREIETAQNAGATLVVIGTAFEKNFNFFEK